MLNASSAALGLLVFPDAQLHTDKDLESRFQMPDSKRRPDFNCTQLHLRCLASASCPQVLAPFPASRSDSEVYSSGPNRQGVKENVCLSLLIYMSSAYSFGCPMATRGETLGFPNKEYNRGAGDRSFSPSRLGSIRSTCPCT